MIAEAHGTIVGICIWNVLRYHWFVICNVVDVDRRDLNAIFEHWKLALKFYI